MQIVSGQFHVGYGNKTLAIEIPFRAEDIELTVVGIGGTGCGQYPKDTVEACSRNNEIMFVCHIESDEAMIEWTAKR